MEVGVVRYPKGPARGTCPSWVVPPIAHVHESGDGLRERERLESGPELCAARPGAEGDRAGAGGEHRRAPCARLRRERGIPRPSSPNGSRNRTSPTTSEAFFGSTPISSCDSPRFLKISADKILGLREPIRRTGSGNRRIARRLEEIERLPRRDQEALLRTTDAFFLKRGDRDGGPVYQYPSELFDLPVQMIQRLCRAETNVITFFEGMGVSQKDLSDLRATVAGDKDSIKKFELVRRVLERINQRRRRRLAVLERFIKFEDFSRCCRPISSKPKDSSRRFRAR